MWLTSFISKNSKDAGAVTKGSVIGITGGSVEVDTAMLNRNMSVVAPYGIAYVPPVGESTVVMPTESGDACVGVLAPKIADLKPGELMLYSAGGATLTLKNDGRVLINGTAIGGV